MTGTDIRKRVECGAELLITASRLYGTAYGVGVQLGPQEFAGPVVIPGSGEPMKFDSLDEVAAFLTQVGVKNFQVAV